MFLIAVIFVTALGDLLHAVITVVFEVIAEFDDLGALLNNDMVLLTVVTLTRISLALCAARTPALIIAPTTLVAVVLAGGATILAVLGCLHALASFF